MISMDKKYRTRDGRDVRLLCVDGPDLLPVIGIIEGDSHASCWGLSGRLSDVGRYHPNDLIEYHEPDIRTIWVNVYQDAVYAYEDVRNAEILARPGAIAIAQPVTFKVDRQWKGRREARREGWCDGWPGSCERRWQ